MRVAKMVVPPSAIIAGLAAMNGDFTTEDVADAVRSANGDVGIDVGEHDSDEFARLVASRLIGKAVGADLVISTGEGTWRGQQQE